MKIGELQKDADHRGAPLTPDYDCYPITHTLTAASADSDCVGLTWSDGRTSRFHAFWLRENEPSPATYNAETRELKVRPLDLPADPSVTRLAIADDGFLEVIFDSEDHPTRFHPGWLRAHDYDNGGRADEAALSPVLWNSETLSEPPTFDGSAYLDDPEVQADFLSAVVTHGFARLRNAPVDPMYVDAFAASIGPVRDNNFGRLWDVRVEPDPQSNAYSSLELIPHTDLCTREYQPGLQVLHCVLNSTSGGEATMVDGFRIADDIRANDPALFQNLTTVDRVYTNRARITDYRWISPPIVLDRSDAVREVRIGAFLRGPSNQPFDQMKALWDADRALYARVSDPHYMLRYRYEPGDLVMFDNRRLLHGRKAFDAATGERWLRGCYIEREELLSAVRMAARRAREQAIL